MHRTLATLLRLALAASLLTVIGLAAALVERIQQQDVSRQWVEHTHQVIDQLREARIQSLLAGAALRNFLILPLEVHLSDSRNAAREAIRATEHLRELTLDNPGQQISTETAVSEMREAMGGLVAAGNVAARMGVEAGREQVAAKVLADSTGDLNRMLDQIEATERDLLERRIAAQQVHTTSMKRLFAVIVAAFVVLSVCAFVYCRRLLRLDLLRTTQLSQDAHLDSLTGLMNRRALTSAVEKMFARGEAEHRTFMVFDLNGFKPINDTHGHAVGDEVLRQVGARLRQQCREGDLVARLGGDEFAMVINQPCSRSIAESVASRLAECLLEPMQIGEMTLTVGVAIGVAVAGEDGHDMASILNSADARMYASKRTLKAAVQAPWHGGDAAALRTRWRKAPRAPSELRHRMRHLTRSEASH